MQSSAGDHVDSPPSRRRNVGVLLTDLFPATTTKDEDPVYRPSPVSSPAVSRRSSLSTRASELGRKLAEERAKNFELQSRLLQNEEKISMLERKLLDSRHSSTRSSNNVENVEPKPKSLEIVVRGPSFQCKLDKAQMLLKQRTDGERLDSAREKSREFTELVHEFYVEQQTHGNQDDVLWLFKEIKVRFDDLKGEYEEEVHRRNTKEAEWRNSLLDLFSIIEAAIEAGSGEQVNNDPPQSETNDHGKDGRQRKSREEEWIQRLEARIIQLEERHEKDRQCMQSEREAFELTREGLAQRIKYLELRGKGSVSSDEEEHIDNMDNGGNLQLHQLRNRVATLSKNLAESENDRANMIEEFQSERANFMEKYQRLAHLLRSIQNDTESE